MTASLFAGERSIVAVARRHAQLTPDRPAFLFLPDGEHEAARYGFGELDTRARAIAAVLQERGLTSERVLIAYPSGLDYVAAFLGCLYGGVVAVPCDTPEAGASRARLRSIRDDCAPAAALTGVTGDYAELDGLPRLDVAAIPGDAAAQWAGPGPATDSLAFLQYTSGSTRIPRGVAVDHGNILANERLIAAACRHDGRSTFVGWQPLFHDMGLVATIMQPLFTGALSVLMPPVAFLQQPARWLRAISRYRAHTSGGPNFAYDLCVDRIPEADRPGLDLSCWQVAFNSAEPVREPTMRRFTAAFGPCGFTATAHFPCYGLAEATLLVTDPGKHRPPRLLRADAGGLRSGQAVPAAGPAPAVPLVSAGRPAAGTDVRIVEPATAQPLAEGKVGEVWVAGASIARGYWNCGPDPAGAFGQRLPGAPGQRFLRTGDLGFLLGGELYLTGRLKDVIVVRGENHYPQDLEWAAQSACPRLRPAAVAAFGIEEDGAERLVLCCELRSYRDGPSAAEIGSLLHGQLLREHGIELHALLVLRRGGVPKTTSGKIRRQACRQAYLSGTLPVHDRADLAGAIRPALPPASRLREAGQERGASLLAAALAELIGGQLAGGPGRQPPAADRPLVELGLNSLQTLELCHAIRHAYGVEPKLAELLGGTTAAGLAAHVAAALAAEPAGALAAAAAPAGTGAPAASAAGPDWAALTWRQRALWYEQQLDPGAAAYQLARAVLIRDVPADRLEQAVARLVRRHEALRTRFAVRDGIPCCQVMPDGPPPVRTDASALTDEQLALLLREEARRPFDLTGEPLARLTVLRRGPREAVLLLVAHHLVADFWSLVVLLRDLAREYQGAGSGGPPAGAHARLAAAEDRWLASGDGQRSRQHWLAELAGLPGQLDLPADGPAPAARGFAGASYPFRMPASLASRLRAAASAHHCTLFSLLLAGYQVLLHRFSGQADLAVGTLLAGREDPEFAGTVGYLANVAAVRSRYRPGQPFSAFLRQTTRGVLGAIEHGSYPWQQLLAELGAERAAAHPPLLQSLFVMHQEQGGREEGLRALALGVPGRLTLGGLRMEALAAGRNHSQLDLSLAIAELDGELAGVWEYRTDMFTEPTIAALTSALTRLLGAAADGPASPVGGLDLCAAPPPLAPMPGPPRPAAGLHELVAEAARQRPAAIAVAQPGGDGGTAHLSNRGLHQAAAGVASQLHALGARPDQPVAVVMERSLEMVVSYLGVLYAGCCVLPVDPADPAARIASTLASSGAGIALTHPRLLRQAAAWPVTAVTPGRPAAGRVRPRAVHREQAAYLLYTSGSTGAPKGAVIPHGSIVNRILWMQEEYRLAAGERVLHKTPLTFDVSMWEIFWPLTAGGCLVLAEPGRHRDPRYLLDVLRREDVSTVHFVPTMLAPVVAEAARGGGPGGRLRRVICSGETLPASLAAAAMDVLGGQVHNLYGPTEAAVDVTAWPCRPGAPGPVPIGRPISHVSCLVLDERRGPLPPRLPGELYLGGRCLARGYLNQPALTASRFVPVPGGRPGTRFYRTGDKVRARTDGALEFLGRYDDQVKLGGIRIEPGEIAETLRRQPGVADAAVVAQQDGDRTVLMAYVVPGPPGPGQPGGPGPGELRARLGELLPAPMIPAAIVPVGRLPVTPSGKLDRRALAATAAVTPGSARDGQEPATPAERLLAGLWAEQLGHSRIGTDQDFFALGGDSILALRLVGAARDAGLQLTVTDVLRDRTIRALAARAGLAGGPVPADAAGDQPAAPFALCPAAAGVAGLADAYPISMGQRALLTQQAISPGYEVYVTSIEVQEPLARAVLAEAVDGAVRRHDYLRSSFDLTTYPEPMQLVHAELPAAFEVIDLSGLPGAARPAVVDRWLAAERRRRFGAGTGPLVRFAAHDLGAAFRLSVSSFALDGWCDVTLLTEVLTDYAAGLRGERGGLTPPRASYRDFVAAERAALRSAGQHAFWATELAGAGPATVQRLGQPAGPAAERRYLVPLPGELPAQLARRAPELGAGLKHLLLAAHLWAVSRLAGQPDIVTGLQFNGRPEVPDGDRVIGMFNNILPLRATVDGGSWAELIGEAARAEARIAPFRRYPLVELQRRLAAASLFETLFVFTHFHAYRQLTAAGLAAAGLRASDQTYLPLTAHANVDAWSGQLRLLLEFDQAQFGLAQIAGIGGLYIQALSAIAAAPRRRYPVARGGGTPERGVPAGPGGPLSGLLDRLAGLTDEQAAALLRGGRRPAKPAPLGGGSDGPR
jgi:nonribosomal peptide synthetase protein BlmVI